MMLWSARMARVAVSEPEDSLEALKAQYAGSSGWSRLAPWAFGAGGLGFAVYLFLVPYGKAEDELQRRSNEILAGRAQVAELQKERDRLKAEGGRAAVSQDRALRMAKFRGAVEPLTARLRKDLAGAEVQSSEERIVVRFPEEAVFEGKGADLSEAGENTLKSFGDLVKEMSGVRILVTARLDKTPVPRDMRDLFPTNWELGAARATNCVRFLADDGAVPPSLLLAGADGDQGGVRRLEIEIAPL